MTLYSSALLLALGLREARPGGQHCPPRVGGLLSLLPYPSSPPRGGASRWLRRLHLSWLCSSGGEWDDLWAPAALCRKHPELQAPGSSAPALEMESKENSPGFLRMAGAWLRRLGTPQCAPW